ncbi:MAG: efflux RND transporter periplasmic adaptor subunit [Gemmatimonadales bacterium]
MDATHLVENLDVNRARLRVAILMGAAIVTACGSKPEVPRAAKTATPVLFVAESATVNVPLSVPSQVYVEQDTWLYARTTGVLDSLLVDIGSTVHAGEVVATLERADQVLALQRAEVSWDSASHAVDRAHEMAQTRSISKVEIDQAEIDLRQADVARAQARRALELTRLVAPFAGVVSARSPVRAGHLVAVGDSIVRVTALGPLRAAVHLPEAEAAGLAVGTVALVSGSGGSMRATVIRAAPTVDAASGTRELVLELAGNSTLRPGASVTVRLGGERRRVIAIPVAATTDSGSVVVWQDGHTSLRAVTLGARLPDGRVEVTSGLAAGERVLPAHK